MDIEKDLCLTFPLKLIDINKYISIIIKKLSCNQIINQIYIDNTYDQKIEFQFKNKFDYINPCEFYFQDVDGNNLNFRTREPHLNRKFRKYKSDNEESIKIYNVDFKIAYQLKINEDKLPKYKNYDFIGISSVLNNKELILNTNFSLNIINNRLEFDNSKESYFSNKINNLTKSIVFFNKYKFDIIPFLLNLNEKINLTHARVINLGTIHKLLTYEKTFQGDKPIELPKQKNINRIIDLFNPVYEFLMKSKNSSMTVSLGIFSLTVNQKKHILMNICGINVVTVKRNFEKYKYINHPGLNLIVKLLEDNNQINDFDYAIQKQMFIRV